MGSLLSIVFAISTSVVFASGGVVTDGVAGFASAFESQPLFQQCSVTWGDFNSDGYPDILASGMIATFADCSLWVNDKHGGFTLEKPFASCAQEGKVYSVDLNRDGKLDAVFTARSYALAGYPLVYLNTGVIDGHVSFERRRTNIPPTNSISLGFGLFPGETSPSVVSMGASLGGGAPLKVAYGWTAVGTSDLTFQINDSLTEQQKNGNFDWADYDRDGQEELLATGDLSGAYLFRKRITSGVHELLSVPNIALAFNVGPPHHTYGKWGDYDNDGFPDVLVGGARAPIVHRNHLGTSFATAVTLSGGVNDFTGEWLDYDNDGYLDLLTATDQDINAYHNVALTPSRGLSPDASTIAGLPSFLSAGTFAVSDYDLDGDPDVVMCGNVGGSAGLRVYRNTLYSPSGTSQFYFRGWITNEQGQLISGNVNVRRTASDQSVHEVASQGGYYIIYGTRNDSLSYGLLAFDTDSKYYLPDNCDLRGKTSTICNLKETSVPPTATPTATATPTETATPTQTPTPAATLTATATPSPSPTNGSSSEGPPPEREEPTATPVATASPTPFDQTAVITPTASPASTPTPRPVAGDTTPQSPNVQQPATPIGQKKGSAIITMERFSGVDPRLGRGLSYRYHLIIEGSPVRKRIHTKGIKERMRGKRIEMTSRRNQVAVRNLDPGSYTVRYRVEIVKGNRVVRTTSWSTTQRFRVAAAGGKK